MRLVLRVPRNSQPQPSKVPAGAAEKAAAPETALGVDGIELREQTHEEALLNTIGKQRISEDLLPITVDRQSCSDWRESLPCFLCCLRSMFLLKCLDST